MAPASLRSAWLMSRACRPMWLSPISPSISALGTRAATESMTMMSTAPERTRISTISSACSPVSGCDTSRFSMSTPELPRVLDVEGMLRIDVGRHPAGLLHVGHEVEAERGLAGGLGAVDLGDPAPRNAADADGGVEVDGAGGNGGDLDSRGESAPIRMMDPLPSCFSIWEMARLSALRRSASSRVSSAAIVPSTCSGVF